MMAAEDNTPGIPKEPLINLAGSEPQDIQRMLEMKKSYEFWQNIMTRKFQEDDKFLPFPKEDEKANLSLDVLNAFRMAEGAQPGNSTNQNGKENTTNSATEGLSEIPGFPAIPGASDLPGALPGVPGIPEIPGAPLLNDTELSFLRTRIAEFISFSGFDQIAKETRSGLDKLARIKHEAEGFSIYGTNDEEGLHDGNGHYDEQDDYDIDELDEQDGFLYDYAPTHHIEVELNDGPPGESHPDEPSCEFTFEYDRNGKLVPTYSNVEEKLRLMSLQSRISGEPLKEGKKKRKNAKKKKKASQPVLDESCCLFCQYEAFFGVKPVHMMRWYDQKILKEEKRRQKIKEKLENAKLKAMKRLRELRQRQNAPEEDLDSDTSRVTVPDQ